MKIESYEFGRIVIDAKSYSTDVIIYPDRVRANWWRKKGHELHKEDIQEIIEAKPEILIIGTGNSGYLKVSNKIRQYIESKGIELKVVRTQEACTLFNKLSTDRKVVAACHLTC
ncbi:MAG: Mth938-like domain-containing protein [Candidatus Helarchaeota archaeon]